MTETRLTAEDRARLRAMAEQATKGEWTLGDTSSGGKILKRGPEQPLKDRHPQTHLQIVPSEDAAHIAAFHPETALALLDQVDALERALREVLDACDGDYVTGIGPIVRARAVLGLPKGEPA